MLLQLGHVSCGEVGGVDPVEVGVAGGGLSRAQLRQACPCLSGQGSFSFVDYRGGAVDDLVVRLFPDGGGHPIGVQCLDALLVAGIVGDYAGGERSHGVGESRSERGLYQPWWDGVDVTLVWVVW